MNRQALQAFQKAYKEYSTHYADKNYDECMEVFSKFDLNGKYLEYSEYIQFLLRSSCHALFSIKNPKIKHKIAVANAFTTVFSEIGNGAWYDRYFLILNWFTNPRDFEKCVLLFADLNPPEFDLKGWLQVIRTDLFRVLYKVEILNDPNQTKQKDIYLQLTRTLLFFVNAETQRAISSKGRWEFSESRRFLDNCQECNLYAKGDKQYKEGFRMLSEFLDCLSSKGDANQIAAKLQKYHIKLRDLIKSNELRATLVQDSFITLAKIIKITASWFTKSVNSNTAISYFDFIGYIGCGSSQSKTEKNLSYCDCEDTGTHLSHDILMLANEIFVKLIDKSAAETKAIEKFAVIVRTIFEAISKLKCSKAQAVQQQAALIFRDTILKCDTKEKSNFSIPVLTFILKRFDRFKPMKGVKYFDEITFLNYLLTAFQNAQQLENMVDVGYLLLAFISTASEPTASFDHHAWLLAKNQKDHKGVMALKTPFDSFKNIKSVDFYGLKLPDSFDLPALSLAYLKVGFKYCVMSTELSNKIVHQLLMLKSSPNTNSLRFVFYIQSINFDQITIERTEKLTKLLRPKSKEDASIGLQLAALKYYKFNQDATEFSEKHKNLSISQALLEEQLASEASIFKEITLDREKVQIETLRYVKKKYIHFTEFYLNQSSDNQKTLEDEKDLLLRDLKMVANQLIIRGYIDDGLDLFMALYRLAEAMNDEFGMIDSCSFFSEYCAEFKRKFPDKDLKSIVDSCFDSVVKKLKELGTLSSRKQNQVCFCMLNLVLFYYEDGGDHKREIHLILSFIFKTIGGIGDKDLGDCMNAAVGFKVVDDKKESTKIHSEAIRIKFYSVLFTIVTKYNAPSTFEPAIFIHFVMEHVKKYLSVYFDTTAAVPILLYNMIPQMMMWLHSVYEAHVNHQGLLMTLVKLAVRSGYAHRAATLMVVLLQVELLCENLKGCKSIFKALDSMTLTDAATEHKELEKVAYGVDESDQLCEPIRKHLAVRSPVKCLTPTRVTGGSQKHFIKYLPNHPNHCECGVCSSPQNKFLMYCIGVTYTRLAYLDEAEFDLIAKRSIFNELLEYWEKKKSKFPRCDLFYVTSAQMFLYSGHHTWKYEKDWPKAKELLKRGLKGLEKVNYGACSMKRDLKSQIEEMEETIKQKDIPREERFGDMWILNRKKSFENEDEDELNVENLKLKKPTAPAKKPAKPQLSLLDMISDSPQRIHSNFQIHGDDEGTAAITPQIKKSSRDRTKKVTETPIRTPSTRVKVEKNEETEDVKPKIPTTRNTRKRT